MADHPTDLLGSVNRNMRFEVPLDFPSRRAMTGWNRRIRQAREKLGWSQTKLGEAVATAQQTIGGYERENPENPPQEPTIEMFLRLGLALNCDPCWLAFGPDYAQNSAIDRQLMYDTVVKFERFVTKAGFGNPNLPPERRAEYLFFAYLLNKDPKTSVDLEAKLQELFGVALRG